MKCYICSDTYICISCTIHETHMNKIDIQLKLFRNALVPWLSESELTELVNVRRKQLLKNYYNKIHK